MRRFLHLKFISSALLLLMLIVTLDGAHESTHAMQSAVTTANSAAESVSPHDTPCTPFEHNQDYDGCDSCVNCACHASLTILPFKISYDPIILDMSTFDLFKHLPEVYLTRFIPPQILA
jgi:hypothetical protein